MFAVFYKVLIIKSGSSKQKDKIQFNPQVQISRNSFSEILFNIKDISFKGPSTINPTIRSRHFRKKSLENDQPSPHECSYHIFSVGLVLLSRDSIDCYVVTGWSVTDQSKYCLPPPQYHCTTPSLSIQTFASPPDVRFDTERNTCLSLRLVLLYVWPSKWILFKKGTRLGSE